MRIVSAVVAALAIGAGSVRANDVSTSLVEIPGSAAQFGIWRWAAYGSDHRTFSHCAASATYTNGVTVTIAVSRGGAWYLEWAHPEWRLLSYEEIQVAVYVDGAGPYLLKARAKTGQSVVAELPTESAILEALRKGTSLVLVTRNARHILSLEGADKAVAEIVRCTTRDVLAPNLPAAHVPTAPTRPDGPRTKEEWANQRVETTIVVSNFLTQGRLPSFRILNESEIRDLNVPGLLQWHTVWRALDLVGALKILPPDVVVMESEVFAALITEEGRNCPGRLSSATISGNVPNAVHLVVTCEADGSGYDARYMIVPRTRGGYYLAGIVRRGSADQRDRDIAKIDSLLHDLSIELGR